MTHIRWRAHLTEDEREIVGTIDATIAEALQAIAPLQQERKKIAARAAMRSIRAGRYKPERANQRQTA